jgi:hypothetical protein
MKNIKLYNEFLNEEYKDLDILNKYTLIALNTLNKWTNNTLKDFKNLSFKDKYDIINNNMKTFLDIISNDVQESEINILLNQQNILVSMIVNKILRYETDKHNLKKLKKIKEYNLN